MDSSRPSKSYHSQDFLPSFRPSYISLILVFACGFLWLKNESTNDRLLALENQMKLLPREGRVECASKANAGEAPIPKPTANFAEQLPLVKNSQIPVTKRPDYSWGKNLCSLLYCLIYNIVIKHSLLRPRGGGGGGGYYAR